MPKLAEKELQEFWKWCGFKHIGGYTIEWVAPDGITCLDKLPPLDLNNLFKYAVPVGFKVFGEDEMHGLLIGWIHSIIYYPETARREPTQALYQAIQKTRRKDK